MSLGLHVPICVYICVFGDLICQPDTLSQPTRSSSAHALQSRGHTTEVDGDANGALLDSPISHQVQHLMLTLVGLCRRLFLCRQVNSWCDHSSLSVCSYTETNPQTHKRLDSDASLNTMPPPPLHDDLCLPTFSRANPAWVQAQNASYDSISNDLASMRGREGDVADMLDLRGVPSSKTQDLRNLAGMGSRDNKWVASASAYDMMKYCCASRF